MMILNGEDENSKPAKVMLADNGIDCCVNVVDNELEEGEIVDDEDDQVAQVLVDRTAEPRQHKINRSWIMNERKVEMERGLESYADSHHGLKRNVNDVDRAEDCMARHKRRRFNRTKEMHRVIRKAKLDNTKNDTDGHRKRETYYGGNVKPVSFRREFENEGCDFQHLRHVRYDRKNSDDVENYHRTNKRRAIPSTSRCSEIKPANKMQKIMKLCPQYKSNRYCYKQDRCEYMHGEFPCKFYHTSKRCSLGDTCRYSHAAIDYSKKKLLLKNAFEDHSSMFVRKKRDVPSLLGMQIPVPEGLKVTYMTNETTSLTSLHEPTVEDISVSTEEIIATQMVYKPASEDYKEISDDDEEMDNLVIDEGA